MIRTSIFALAFAAISASAALAGEQPPRIGAENDASPVAVVEVAAARGERTPPIGGNGHTAEGMSQMAQVAAMPTPGK